MDGESTNRMQCAQFEGLLVEAVEGRLTAAQNAEFRDHARTCQVCGPMLADALAGFDLLHSLEEVEPPRHLVHNILLGTSGVVPVSEREPGTTFGARLRQWLLPVFAPLAQPRIAGSLAMAFFSLTLIMNLAGFKMSDLRHLDLRPSAIRQGISRQYYATTARVVKYYDSLRVVYELQARFGDLKQQMTPAEQEQKPAQQKKEKDDKNITRRPQPKREPDYYSQRDGSVKMAYQNSISMAPHVNSKRRDA